MRLAKARFATGKLFGSFDMAIGQFKNVSSDMAKVGTAIDSVKKKGEGLRKVFSSDPFKVFARSTGIRVLWDLHREKFKAFANFDQIALQVGKMGLAIQGLSGILMSSIGNLLSWGRGLVQIAGAGIALPGILAGVGAAGWALSAALKEIDEYLPGFKEGMDALNSSMSAALWDRAVGPLENLGKKVFPEFAAGMEQVADATGILVGKLADGLTKNFGGQMAPMFNDISKGILNASKGMDGLTKGLRHLIEAGTRQLPALGTAFANFANDFGNNMAKWGTDGSLDRWISNGVKQFKMLWAVVRDTGMILASLSEYAEIAGASTLTTLAATMARAREVVESASFKEVFIDMLSDANAFASQVGDALMRGLGTFLPKIGPIFSESIRQLGPPMAQAINGLFAGLSTDAAAANFTTFFAGLREGFSEFAPLMEIVGQKITIVLALIGTAFSNLAPIVASFVEELAEVLTKIQGPATTLMDTLGTSMQQVIEGLSPIFAVLADTLARVLEILTPLAAAFGGWGSVLAAAAPVLQGVATTIMNFLEPIISKIADKMPEFQAAWENLLTTLQPMMPVLETIGTALGFVASILIDVFMSAVTSIISGIAGFIAGLQQMWTGLSQIFEGIKQIFSGNFAEGFRLIWEGLKNVVIGAIKAIVNAVKVWLNVTIVGALRGGLVKILTSWRGGWMHIANAAKIVWGVIVSGVRGLTTKILSGIIGGMSRTKSAWTAAWNAMKTGVTAIWNAIVTGVASFVVRVGNGAKRIGTVIGQAVSSAISIVKGKVGQFVSVGGDLISGLVRGIQAGIGRVADAARNVAERAVSAAKSALGIQSPSRVFRDIGKFTAMGLAEGIANSGHLAVEALKDVAKDMSKVPMELDDVTVSTGNIDRFSTAAMNAAATTPVGQGSQAAITQNFYQSNVDAEESYRLLRMGIKTARMSGAYATN